MPLLDGNYLTLPLPVQVINACGFNVKKVGDAPLFTMRWISP